MALYKDTNLTLYEVKHCVSGTCKANTRQWIHKLKLTCACDHPNITSHIFRHPCHHSRRPRVVRDWNHPIYMGLWPGAHFWGQGGGGHSPKGIPSLLMMCWGFWKLLTWALFSFSDSFKSQMMVVICVKCVKGEFWGNPILLICVEIYSLFCWCYCSIVWLESWGKRVSNGSLAHSQWEN